MNIDLNKVDEFEQQFGHVTAFGRARDFMIDYLGKLQTPLPAVAAEGLAIARKFQNAEVGPDQVEKARLSCWSYLNERSASTDFTTPEHCAIRAAISLLYVAPAPGDDAIDLIDFFLNLADRFEPHSDDAVALLEKYFP
jgi:hypothetical protein